MTPEEQQAFVDTIYGGLSDADIKGMEARGFEAEVMAVNKVVTKMCDDLCQHFDPHVVVAALEITLNDFVSLLDDTE